MFFLSFPSFPSPLSLYHFTKTASDKVNSDLHVVEVQSQRLGLPCLPARQPWPHFWVVVPRRWGQVLRSRQENDSGVLKAAPLLRTPPAGPRRHWAVSQRSCHFPIQVPVGEMNWQQYGHYGWWGENGRRSRGTTDRMSSPTRPPLPTQPPHHPAT